MTETESLIAEVRLLRADVARLHASVQVRHSWMQLFIKDLSTNPHTQYKVHMWGAIYWLINFPLICQPGVLGQRAFVRGHESDGVVRTR